MNESVFSPAQPASFWINNPAELIIGIAQFGKNADIPHLKEGALRAKMVKPQTT